MAATTFASCSLDRSPLQSSGALRILLDQNNSTVERRFTDLLSIYSLGPGSTSDFSCFLVNVNGSGIPHGTLPRTGCDSSDEMKGRGAGIVSLPAARGQSIQLTVPTGSNRNIDVYGIYPALPECGGTEPRIGSPAGGYFLGGIVVSLLQDTSVNVPISYTSAQSSHLTCTGSAPPLPPPPLLGQTDPTSVTARTGAGGIYSAAGLFSDGIRLAVADASYNRILIWNTIPTVAGQDADLVLGQSDFSGIDTNRGGAPAANTLYNPDSVAIFGDKLLVADANNNRVLIWNTFPTVNGQPADVVIGQPDFTSNSVLSPAANTMNTPTSVAVSVTGELYVVAQANNQVLYFTSIPTSNNASAQFVIGQPSFTSTTSGAGSNQLFGPFGVAVGNFGVAIADQANSRVMIFNTPTANNSTATHVLGQTSFGSNSSNCSANGMNSPSGLFIKGNSLYVADSANERILKRDLANSVSNGQSADHVFGQPDMVTCTPSTTQTTFTTPVGVYSDASNYLFVADQDNFRVTINSFL